MDEKLKAAKPKQKKKKGDYFLTVSLMQITFCAFLCLIVFVCAKTNADAKASLCADFETLMRWNLAWTDAKDVMQQVKDYVSSTRESMAVFGGFAHNVDDEMEPYEAATAQTNEATTSAAPETTAPTTTVETAASATSDEENGAGGEDVTAMKAKENTTFSPTAVTVPIVRPVSGGRYSSKFGYRVNPITGAYSFHTGLDIAVPLGTKIKAAYNGQVRAVGEDSHSGKYVIVTHDNGFETFYCHCSETLTAEGEVVRAGEVIALVGSTGWSTGPHLHFEVRKDGERLDPLPLLENDA